MISINNIKQNGWLVFETIVGSKAYGLDTATSDTDIRGVFVLPKDHFYGLEYIEQVNNESNDIVYYELKRFIELLANNNPNILEMLAVPAKCILFKHPLMNEVSGNLFLSKLCEKSFANYAFTQIKKASGLEKKIMNPMDKERKSVMDFCFVNYENTTVSLKEFLAMKGFSEANCGLSKMNHFKDCYHLFYSTVHQYFGVVKNENANEVHLTSIPKGEKSIAVLFFNKDAYSIYCKQYKEYWDWVEKRNEERYKGTMSHGKKYDAKNMMHVFRLLNMAKEIALDGKANIWREDREFLLDIKQGKYEYEELVEKATILKDGLHQFFEKSTLPETPNYEEIEGLLVKIRKAFYKC